MATLKVMIVAVYMLISSAYHGVMGGLPEMPLFVGNVNTMVYHVSTCESVDKMKEINKYIMSTQEQAAEWNFRACKNCKPERVGENWP